MSYKDIRKKSNADLQEDIDVLISAKKISESDGNVSLAKQIWLAICELLFEKSRRNGKSKR
jgi:hypothetical protein